MPAGAEILAIGTEILLGEIVDTNTQFIARALRAIGLDLFRTATVGDNAERIAQAVRDALQRAQVVITTGGLGPTVDDATREGIARAMTVELEFRTELWDWILERFLRYGVKPTENNRRQAMLPAGAQAIINPMGTAPAFRIEREGQVVISLPGVPAEMEYLLEAEVLPYLRRTLNLHGVIASRVVRVSGIGESWLDEHIGDLEQLSNPTVGLSAHPGRVDIRVTAKAASQAEAEELIWGIQATLEQRLKDRIYGVDNETLEGAVLRGLRARGWRLVAVEAGTGGALGAALAGEQTRTGVASDSVGLSSQTAPPGAPADAPAISFVALTSSPAVFAGARLLPDGASREALAEAAAAAMQETGAEVSLQLLLSSGPQQHALFAAMRSPGGEQSWERSYGGAMPNAPLWAVSLALDYLRRELAAD
jgi:competence/damage-inducible protein CinA-like protein